MRMHHVENACRYTRFNCRQDARNGTIERGQAHRRAGSRGLGGCSSWNGEVSALLKQGYDVRAIANPLENLTTDADYVRTSSRR